MIYYFIGIKGSGMSALACVLYDLGYNVTGSDKTDHFFTEEELIKRNIKMLPFSETNIKKDMVIIKGNAFNDDHIEVKKAKELGLKIHTYQSMIREITDKFKLIAISGCHGKTTTTKMLSKVFENIGINYLVGDGSGYAKANNEYFALEACEWKRHFLEYNPYYIIITNIELDHTDYYKDLDDVIDAFNSFASKAKKGVIMCGDDNNTRKIKTSVKTLYYGFKDNNNVIAKNIIIKDDTTICDVYINNEYFDTYTFPFIGDHLILNVLSVISICYLENIDKNEIKNQILKIEHAKRRFIEEKFNDNILIDDYAHHPTEVKVTIEAAKKKYPNKKVIAIFRAHTKSRVKDFAKLFADALNIADESYITDICEDRIEIGYDDISYKTILEYTNNCKHIDMDDPSQLFKYHNAVILFMSSKDIYVLKDKYKELYNKR